MQLIESMIKSSKDAVYTLICGMLVQKGRHWKMHIGDD